ncbi:MAG: sugar ABC transporter permease [Kosmotoga sp.]|nr:MAG: sugar ABC transporter permease [Kosmotoga sp.]
MALSKRGRTIILGYLMILPSFVFLMIFTYYPVFRSIWLSLFQKVAGGVTQFVGLENYQYMFGSNLFRQVMWNNLIYSLGSTIPAVALGLLFALLINKKLKLRGFFRFSIFYPTMLPIAAASMIWIFLFSQSYGLVNKILELFNLPSNIDWLNTSPQAMVAIIIVSVWKFSGYYMLLFLAGLQNIDESLYEAALLEGANVWQKFRKITFPLLSPTTFFVTLLAVINSFQAVDQIYVMTRGGPYNTTNVLLYYIYQNGFVYWDTGIASSASVILFSILLVFTFIYYFELQRFVHYEG